MPNNYTILAIETSLDDTCAAVTVNNRVISNVIASQVSHHAEWGGTVPDIAKRLHQEWLTPTVDKALRLAHITNPAEKLDAIAVTVGPGLAPSLKQGIDKAIELAKKWNLPLIAVNHLEGHLLAPFATNSKGQGPLTKAKPQYPALGFIISGGHTQLVLMQSIGEYQLLGATLDDAAGEAYDKVARMLELGYPGGPILSELAKQGTPKYPLPIPMRQRKDLNFSFSGLKTAAMHKLKELDVPRDRQFTLDFAASFQESALTHLMDRFTKAIQEYQPRMILLGGGVVSNLELRKRARQVARKHQIPVFIPYTQKLITDNAAMIGVTAYYQSLRNDFVKNPNSLDRLPNLNFSPIAS